MSLRGRTRSGKCCAECGQELPWLLHGLRFQADTGIVERAGLRTRLAPLRMQLLETLIDAFPGAASPAHITDVLYAERRREPGPTTVKMHVSYLRTALTPLGVLIDGVPGYGYRLVFEPLQGRQRNQNGNRWRDGQ